MARRRLDFANHLKCHSCMCCTQGSLLKSQQGAACGHNRPLCLGEPEPSPASLVGDPRRCSPLWPGQPPPTGVCVPTITVNRRGTDGLSRAPHRWRGLFGAWAATEEAPPPTPSTAGAPVQLQPPRLQRETALFHYCRRLGRRRGPRVRRFGHTTRPVPSRPPLGCCSQQRTATAAKLAAPASHRYPASYTYRRAR